MRVWITARGVAWYSVFRLQKQFSNEMIGYLPQRKIERVWYNLRIIKYFERNFGKFETHVLNKNTPICRWNLSQDEQDIIEELNMGLYSYVKIYEQY